MYFKEKKLFQFNEHSALQLTSDPLLPSLSHIPREKLRQKTCPINVIVAYVGRHKHTHSDSYCKLVRARALYRFCLVKELFYAHFMLPILYRLCHVATSVVSLRCNTWSLRLYGELYGARQTRVSVSLQLDTLKT